MKGSLTNKDKQTITMLSTSAINTRMLFINV